jgi:F0F1-type ATP synthase assembly protein I
LNLSKVLLSFIIFSALLAVPPIILTYVENGYWLITDFWGVFIFLSLLTLIATFAVLLVQKNNSEMYGQAFLAATTFKLLATLVFILIFIKETKPLKIVFVVDFMYLYFLNMAFEIYGLLRNLRNQNSR